MGLFTKKEINSQEYEKILRRIAELDSAISALSGKVDSLFTNQQSLRGMVNRRFSKEEESEEEMPGTPLEKSLKSISPFNN